MDKEDLAIAQELMKERAISPDEAFLRALSPNQKTLLLDKDNNSLPWLPLEQEPPLDYLAFALWRDAGPSRPDISPKNSLAKRWNWHYRAALFDQNSTLSATEGLCTAEQALKSEREIIYVAIQTIKNELAKFAKQSAQSSQPVMTPEAMIGALEKLVKLERLVNGLSTENVSVRTGNDYSRLTDEEFAALEILEEKTRTL